MKVVTVVGARPQFIKAGTLSRAMSAVKNIDEVIIHTGQHYDANMSDVFFSEMAIPQPKYNLGVGGTSHGAMTGEMIKHIEMVLMREEPRCVLLYGDTNSTLAGAVAASKLHIPIVHVEAGLRSFNMQMPEEINRIVTDRLSQLLFCPTDQALQNLENEGLNLWPADAYIVGDVMQDGAWFYGERALRPENFSVDTEFVLCTVHRAENTDDRDSLTEIFSALRNIAMGQQVIMPLHPRTAVRVKDYGISLEGISVVPPVGYLTMIWLIKNSRLVITDSGGLQKEAFFFSKCCITLRPETEWVELVRAGVNALAGSSAARILTAFQTFKTADDFKFDQNLYGGGNAADKIVRSITGRFG